MPLEPSDLLLSQVSEEDFKEIITDIQSQRVDTFSAEVADFEMTFLIPGDKLKAAIQWVIGVDYVGKDNKLHRTLPMFHPVYPWAWANSARVRGWGQDGDDTEAVQWMYQSTPAKWQKYELTVSFSMPDGYEIWEDDDITTELERYTSFIPAPAVKLVSVDGGQLAYDLPSLDTAKHHGQIHAGLIPLCRKESAGYKFLWKRVPEEYLQSSHETVPVKLLQAQGKVNSAVFLGQPAETFLCTDAKIVRKYLSPITTDTAASFYWLCDVEIEMEFLKQLDSEIADGVSETRRGHNLVLGPGQQWYYAKNKASPYLPTYPGVDFYKLWTHYSDTF